MDNQHDNASSPDRVDLENTLHALDAELSRLRQRMFLLETGVVSSPDRDAELARLRERFSQASNQFLVTYRRWNAGDATDEPAPRGPGAIDRTNDKSRLDGQRGAST